MRASEILRNTTVEISPESFTLVSLPRELLRELLNDPRLSPRLTAPFMMLLDRHEVTLLVDEIDLANILPGLTEAKIEQGYRILTFDVVLDLSVTGFIAEISRILAAADVPILPISAFSRDHILIKQNDLATALKALGPHVGELC